MKSLLPKEEKRQSEESASLKKIIPNVDFANS